MSDFNLSESLCWTWDETEEGGIDNMCIPVFEFKEFIKRLKEELHSYDWDIVNRLAGDKLI